MNKAAQQLGRRGGLARKAQKPDYAALGRKGMAKRWGKKQPLTGSTYRKIPSA